MIWWRSQHFTLEQCYADWADDQTNGAEDRRGICRWWLCSGPMRTNTCKDRNPRIYIYLDQWETIPIRFLPNQLNFTCLLLSLLNSLCLNPTTCLLMMSLPWGCFLCNHLLLGWITVPFVGSRTVLQEIWQFESCCFVHAQMNVIESYPTLYQVLNHPWCFYPWLIGFSLDCSMCFVQVNSCRGISVGGTEVELWYLHRIIQWWCTLGVFDSSFGGDS